MSNSDTELLSARDRTPALPPIRGRGSSKRKAHSPLSPSPTSKRSKSVPKSINRNILVPQRNRARSEPPRPISPIVPLPDYSSSSSPSPSVRSLSPSPISFARPSTPPQLNGVAHSPEQQPPAHSPERPPAAHSPEQPLPVHSSEQPLPAQSPEHPPPADPSLLESDSLDITDPIDPPNQVALYNPLPFHNAPHINETWQPSYVIMSNNDLAQGLNLAFDKLCLASYANKLPTFSGERGGTGFMDFLERFNEIGNIMGLTEAKMVYLLPAHLKGAAKAVFDNLSVEQKQNWRLAVTKLQQHFSTDYFLDMARDKLMNMRMELGESPVVFSNRVRKEVLDAYPSRQPDERQFLQSMIFTNALPRTVTQKLKLIGPLPSNYDKLVEEAERIWNITKSNPNSLEEGILIAKMDKVLDTISSTSNYPPSTKPFYFQRPLPPRQPPFRNYTRSYNSNNFPNKRPYNPNFRPHNRYNQNRNYQQRNSRPRSQSPPRNTVTFGSAPYSKRPRPQTPYFRRPGNYSNRNNNQNNRNSSQRYRVNSIIIPNHKPMLGSMPFLFVLAIICSLIPTASTYSLKYQVCAAGKSGWPIAYPDQIQCTTSPNSSDVLITAAHLYVERTEPLLLPAFHCFNKTRKICASSYLHISFSVNSDEEYMNPIDPNLCKSLATNKKYEGEPLEQLSPGVYGSSNQIHYSYPWFFGEKCTLTTNIYMEQGDMATFDGEHIVGQFGDMSHCNIAKEQCYLRHGTVIWTRPHPTSTLCRYTKAIEGVAYVTPDHVIINTIQSAFTYKNVTYKPSQLLKWCLKKNSIPMDNGVFITLPELEDYNPRTVFTDHPDVVQEINQRHFYDSQLVHFVNAMYTSARTARTVLYAYKDAKPEPEPMTTFKRSPEETHTPTLKPTKYPPVRVVKDFLNSLKNKTLDKKSFKFGIQSRNKREEPAQVNVYNYKALDTMLDPRESPLEISPQTYNKIPYNTSAQIAHHIALNSEPDFTVVNNDPMLHHEQRQDQRHAELNTKMQFLKLKMEDIIKQDFNFLLDRICSLINFKIQSIKSIAQINPTSAARILLQRDDIFALATGDVLMISKCKEIIVDEIIFDHNIGGTCYVYTPVRSGKTHYFIQPGTRDLVTSSPEADCGHLPFGIYNDGNNHYKSPSGYTPVTNIHLNLPNGFARQDFIFNAPPIFHSDLAKISTDIYLIKQHLESIDNFETAKSKSVSIDIDPTSFPLHHELANTAQFLEANAGHVLQTQKQRILASIGLHKWVRTLVITTFGILFFAMLTLLYIQSTFFRLIINIVLKSIPIGISFIVSSLFTKKSSQPPNPPAATDRPLVTARRRARQQFDEAAEPTCISVEFPPFSDVPLNDMKPCCAVNKQQSVQIGSNQPSVTYQKLVPTKNPPKQTTTLPTSSTKPQSPTPQPRQNKDFLSFLPSVSCILRASTNPLMYIQTHLNNKHIIALIDTGSAISLVSESVARQIKACILRPSVAKGITANGTPIHLLGQFTPTLLIGDKTIEFTCYVAADENCSSPFILGNDAIPQLAQKLLIDYGANTISFDETTIPFVTTTQDDHNLLKLPVYLTQDTTLPPFSDNAVIGTTYTTFPQRWEVFTTDDPTSPLSEGLLVGRSLSCPNSEGSVLVRIYNSNPEPTFLPKNTTIATASFVGTDMPWLPVFSIYNQLNQKALPLKHINGEYIPAEADFSKDLPLFPDSQPPKPLLSKIQYNHSILDNNHLHAFKILLNKYKQCFVGNDGNLGRYTGPITHSINFIPHHKIPKQRPYRVPLEKRQEIEHQIKEMLRTRIIEPSTSPFASPIVLVKKGPNKDQWRFTVDYRQINAITETETYCIPHMQDILDLVNGKEIYSVLDFKSGFFQIPLTKEHRERTAFSSFMGLYHFTVMAQGLKGAPGTFQRVANNLIRDVRACCFAYIDDIIIASQSISQHLLDLEEIFVRIRRFGMKLTPEKCSFFQTEVQYLGVFISKNGTRPNPQKVASIAQIPSPKNVKDIKSFLGAASYFRRYIPRFSIIATPLNNLLIKNTPFVWTEVHEKAFLALKQALINAPLLVAPIFGQPYIIHTDASTIGLGACLLQTNPTTKSEQPIAYCSRSLNKHEKNYAVIELEALAIVFALTHFYPYVANARITLVTDHAPLKSLLHRSDLVGRLAKYQISIQAYDLTIEYRAGKHNTFCDFLSRYPLPRINSIIANTLPSLADIQESQRSSKYGQLIKFLNDEIDEPPQEFENKLEQFSMINNSLFYTIHDEPKLVVPDETMQLAIITAFHDTPLLGSHLGIQKTYNKIKEKYFWPNLFQDVSTYINSCPVCQKVKTPSKHIIREELGSFSVPQRPFERIHTDVIGPLPQCMDGSQFISITVCAFSKFVVCTPLAQQTTESVVKALINDVISKHGVPKELVSDRGSNYTSEMFIKINKALGITNKFTTSYNHKANGQAERLVKVITDSLTVYCSEARDHWTDFLQPIVFAYNCSKNVTTGYSPFFVVHGRCPITWSDIIHELPTRLVFSTDDFADQFTAGLQNTIMEVGNEIANKTKQYKTGYDLSNKVYPTELSIGDLVLLHDDTVRPKLTNQWKGPYAVAQIDRPNIVITNIIGRTVRQTVHINRLKLYSPRSMAANVSTPTPNPQTFMHPEETSAATEQTNVRRSRRLQIKQAGSRTSWMQEGESFT